MNKISGILILAILAVTPVSGHSQAPCRCCPDDVSSGSGLKPESCAQARLCWLDEEAPVAQAREARPSRSISPVANITIAGAEVPVSAPAVLFPPAPVTLSGFGSPAIPLVLRC
jgi:hypothetical protein